jgi:hypothetical protein
VTGFEGLGVQDRLFPEHSSQLLRRAALTVAAYATDREDLRDLLAVLNIRLGGFR